MNGVPLKQHSPLKVSILEVQFSKQEIKAALFGLKGNRAPSLDGFPIAFFQHFWDLLEKDFLAFINEFHVNGVTLGELGASLLALIPKKDDAIYIKDFKSISLIGSLYKILAKVLVSH